MKKIFIYIIALLPLAVLAQEPQSFQITGKIGTLNSPARAYLLYQVGANKVVDSAIISNGAFDFKGEIMNPGPALLVIDRKGVGLQKLDSTTDVLNFYVDKGSFEINSPDSAAKAQITGSKINDDNKKLMAGLKPVIEQARKLKALSDAAAPAPEKRAEFANAMQVKYKALQDAQKTVLKDFILSHNDSYLSLIALYSVGGPSPNPAEIDPLYDSLSAELKATETAKVFKKSLDELRNTAIGSAAPDFTENDVNGAPVKLSSFRGKYVLLDFWASWCGPCRQENPNVVKAYTKYKDKNFTILSVSLDRADGRAAWLAAIKNDGLTWTHVSDLKFWNNAAAGLYSVTSIPANFLIDPNGKIIARDLRGQDLEDKLQEVLGK